MDQHFREINGARGLARRHGHGHAGTGYDGSRPGNDCHGTLQLSTEYLVNHVPFLVLRKIQTTPQCTDHMRAEQNFAKMLSDFRDHARPMVVDVDHELALLNSNCEYIYLDFDWGCYNNPGNQSWHDMMVDDPFAAVRQPRPSPLRIESCMTMPMPLSN